MSVKMRKKQGLTKEKRREQILRELKDNFKHFIENEVFFIDMFDIGETDYEDQTT